MPERPGSVHHETVKRTLNGEEPLNACQSHVTSAVRRDRRLLVAFVVGVLGGVRTTMLLRGKTYPADFEQVWFAARALLKGHDPYALIGPGRAFPFDFQFHYPLTAAVVAIPVTPFSADVACGVFLGLGLAALAWALMHHGHAPLIGLVSAAAGSAIDSTQWSPILAAAIAIPPLGVFFVAKPTIGLAMFAARPSRWAILGGLAVAVVAFLVRPSWAGEWREAVADQRGMTILIRHPGGIFALLALFRWRRPEARMLAVLACVPMTPALYETVPLLLIPRRWWEAAFLVLASYGVLGWAMRTPLSLATYGVVMTNSANAFGSPLTQVPPLMAGCMLGTP